MAASLALGYVASVNGRLPVVAVGVSAIIVLTIVAAQHLRARELVLWLVVFVAIFNFAPALFTPTNLNAEPLWQKAIKDGPILLLLVVSALAPRTLSTESRSATNAVKALVALVALLMLLDLAFRDIPLLPFLASFRYYVAYPLVALAIYRLDYSRDEMLRVGTGLVILAVLEGGLAVPNFLGVIGESYFEGYVSFGGVTYSRATGTLGNPNNLGLFLGLPAVLLITRAVFDDWRGRVLLGPILLGMALSFSKTVALALIVTTLAVAAIERGRRGGWFRIALMVGIAGGLLYLTVFGRVSGGAVAVERLLGARTLNVPAAFTDWTSSAGSFLFGNGYGSQVTPPSSGAADVITTDNMPLLLALEGGIFGLLMFSALVFAFLRIAVRTRRSAPSALSNGLAAYLIFFLLYAPVANNFQLFPGALFFWVAAGFLATLGSTTRKGKNELDSVTIVNHV